MENDSHRFDGKEYFIRRIIKDYFPEGKIKILDVGCGRAHSWRNVLNDFPNISYQGVEPDPKSAEAARKNLEGLSNARISDGLFYESSENDFDLCISLSVLEHVKQLPKFLKASVDAVKKGGLVVHRYDLGHSLFPSSLKEKFQVWLGNNFPSVLPEHKFVRYLSDSEVSEILAGCNATTIRRTWHQMPDHKKLLSIMDTSTPAAKSLAQELCEWEFKMSEILPILPQKSREKLFPSVTVWAKKV
ncbi:MAG TPA: class I SAM-dependent methyltransferase [Candidatus Paceibacterota bacterium]|nr:class I SAM-dependent methyltransferase [Candidatus Paceibacterota bacterium]